MDDLASCWPVDDLTELIDSGETLGEIVGQLDPLNDGELFGSESRIDTV